MSFQSQFNHLIYDLLNFLSSKNSFQRNTLQGKLCLPVGYECYEAAPRTPREDSRAHVSLSLPKMASWVAPLPVLNFFTYAAFLRQQLFSFLRQQLFSFLEAYGEQQIIP